MKVSWCTKRRLHRGTAAWVRKTGLRKLHPNEGLRATPTRYGTIEPKPELRIKLYLLEVGSGLAHHGYRRSKAASLKRIEEEQRRCNKHNIPGTAWRARTANRRSGPTSQD